MSPRTHAEIYTDAAGEWRSRVFDANGHELFKSSEGYENRADCVDVLRHFGPIPIDYLNVTDPTEES